MFGMGPTELMIVFGIFVLLFGGAKLPGLARSMGQSIKEFKDGMREAELDEFKKADPGPTV